jgi:hypothetical protein
MVGKEKSRLICQFRRHSANCVHHIAPSAGELRHVFRHASTSPRGSCALPLTSKRVAGLPAQRSLNTRLTAWPSIPGGQHSRGTSGRNVPPSDAPNAVPFRWAVPRTSAVAKDLRDNSPIWHAACSYRKRSSPGGGGAPPWVYTAPYVPSPLRDLTCCERQKSYAVHK